MPGVLPPALIALSALSLACLPFTGMPAALQCAAALAASLYAAHGLRRLRALRPCAFVTAADGTLWRHEDAQAAALESPRWHDYGYLAVLYYRVDGRRHCRFWLPHAMPAPDIRQMRLMMNAASTPACGNMPGIAVNPVL